MSIVALTPACQSRRDRRCNPHRDCGIRRHRIDARSRARRNKSTCAGDRLTPGTVVRARIEFDEGHDYKVRPAIVVNHNLQGIALIPCTATFRRLSKTNVPLMNLKSAGLTRRTSAQTHRVRNVEKSDCIEVLGHLAHADFTRILAPCTKEGHNV